MSEDPALTAALVAAYVRGMQNNSGADAANGPYLMVRPRRGGASQGTA